MLVNGGVVVMDNFGPATYGQRIAESYDEIYPSSSNTDAMVETLAKLAGAGPVLELGIGTGRVALPLASNGLTVHGIDASEAMIKRLQAKAVARQYRLLSVTLRTSMWVVGSR